MAAGRTNREIGDVLGMSAKTVMHHSVAIYRKLGVAGRSAATAWAFQNGVMD
jgi:DNA-binding NarL/FixJ family response regulator